MPPVLFLLPSVKKIRTAVEAFSYCCMREMMDKNRSISLQSLAYSYSATSVILFQTDTSTLALIHNSLAVPIHEQTNPLDEYKLVDALMLKQKQHKMRRKCVFQRTVHKCKQERMLHDVASSSIIDHQSLQ